MAGRSNKDAPETAFILLRMNPFIKGLLIVCQLYGSAMVALMSMGAWDVKNDTLDGALIGVAILTGIVGLVVIMAHDRGPDE